MPLIVKRLGYTLAPGERFTSGPEDLEDDLIEKYSKSEINRDEDILSKIKELDSAFLKSVFRDHTKPNGSKSHKEGSYLDSKQAFVEHLSVVGDLGCDESVELSNVENHLKELASAIVRDGLAKLTDLNIAFNRPGDFYAEMLKSDEQMGRIVRALERKALASAKAKASGGKKAKRLRDSKDGGSRKLSKKQFQLQQKNKFIKSVNALRKKAGDKDKAIDRLISSSNSSKRSAGRNKNFIRPNKISKSAKAKSASAKSKKSGAKRSKKAVKRPVKGVRSSSKRKK